MTSKRQAPAPTAPHDLKTILRYMRKKHEPFWISGVFFRPWTVYLSALFIKLGISANAVTLISGVSLVLGSFLVVSNNTVALLAAAWLCWFYFVLDHCDGEIARYHMRTSGRPSTPDGAFWDSVGHGLEVVPIGLIAYRLREVDEAGSWVYIVALVTFVRYALAPWKRYWQVMMKWGGNQAITDRGVELVMDPRLFLGPHEAAGGDDQAASSGGNRPWKLWIKQAVSFPGYWMSLPITLVMDAFLPPIPVLQMPWMTIWFMQICLLRGFGGFRGIFALGERLHQVEVVKPASSREGDTAAAMRIAGENEDATRPGALRHAE